MDFGKCPICHEYGFMPHTCKPTFFVFRDSDDLWESIGDSSIKRVFASDKEQAAIEYCESDYEIPSDLDVTVISTKDWNDIIDELYVRAKIEEGLKDLDEGKSEHE